MKILLQKLFRWIYPQLGWLSNANYDFSKLRSWENNVKKGKNVVVKPVVHLCDVEIGDYTYVSYDCVIDNATIGKFCSIGLKMLCGWGIHPINGISTSPMFYSTRKQNGCTLSHYDKIVERKRIIIGNDVWIGANVIVLDGVTIGDGAVIGAGAVVSKDIPPYAIAVGCPIQIKNYRFNEEQIQALLRIKWWDFPDEELQNIEQMFFDIDSFIAKYDTKQ